MVFFHEGSSERSNDRESPIDITPIRRNSHRCPDGACWNVRSKTVGKFFYRKFPAECIEA
jgi:hypothetical protein